MLEGVHAPTAGSKRQGIVSHTWIHGNLGRSTAAGSQALRYCLSGLKAFHMFVLLGGGCITVRAWGLSVNDLCSELVRLGLENSVPFIGAKPSFLVLVTAHCLHFFGVKARPRPASTKGVLTHRTFLSILGTCCDLPCYSNPDAGTWAVLQSSTPGQILKNWKAEGLAMFGVLICLIPGCSLHPKAILILPLIPLSSWPRGDRGWNDYCPRGWLTLGVPCAESAPIFRCDVLFNSGSVALQLSQTQADWSPVIRSPFTACRLWWWCWQALSGTLNLPALRFLTWLLFEADDTGSSNIWSLSNDSLPLYGELQKRCQTLESVQRGWLNSDLRRASYLHFPCLLAASWTVMFKELSTVFPKPLLYLSAAVF